MSKAEERAKQRALEAYPKDIEEYIDVNGVKSVVDNNSWQRTIFLKGYHQAEKDLDVVSWVKEVSGVKELSRAKEEALKAYPPQNITANYGTINRRDAFEYGYLKAEKDNELTWEDMRELYIIFAEVDTEIELCKADDITAETIGYYQEVLKRFKERKEK